ncbi:metal ABC transporter solute-binding protein, Zn/Mn family [Desulfopila sp. IMCC35008]|uniref:metal ABC transporter solute-binding protein, Zn/Mn family n=1 Tax=Desulfopila sp. IMCC35008 TaxID=2653858 RepID=UPI0013D6FE7F|nr:zinc ABC transporter substrate-binding protein [Desulfopila sp. IMCC35008]
MRRTVQWLFLLFLIILSNSTVSAKERDTVFVSILPQKFFVQQISGESLQVEVMVKPGASPATYEPKPSQMRKLSKSSLYFSVGVPFENVWLERLTDVNPEMTIIHTDKGIHKLTMAAHHHEEDGHEEDGHEEEAREPTTGLDPHIWLSPVLVKKQAKIIGESLIARFPEREVHFRKNLALFLSRVDELHGDLQEILRDKKGTRFMVFHPSWGYWAHEYGLEQVAVEMEGKNPKPAQLQELIEQAREENIHVIFAQPQFSVKSAKVIARELKGTVITIDPLAENWFENMRHVADIFKKTVQ